MAIAKATDTEIKRKADNNIKLDSPTPEKLTRYNAYQKLARESTTAKAQSGEKLTAPTAWKNEIYAQAQNGATPQQPQSNIDPRMKALEDILLKGANAQYQSQEALLGQTRDAQILELQKSLADAISEGQISVREAEAQFEEQKGVIEQQAYQDAERTGLMSQERGIQNSAQAIGLMQGDNARKNSMINTNMTTRDKRLADVKDRLNNIKNKTSLDITNANANYGYGLANAKGQIDAQLNQNRFNMGMEDYKMDKQQEFDLAKMDKQQVQVLEQMAKSFGYDIRKMDKAQVQQLAQMAQQFGYSQSLQNDSQSFQQQESARSRMFEEKMFGKQQSAKLAEYDLALERELASYDSDTPEGQLRIKQLESAKEALMQESQAKFLADTMGKLFTDHVGNPPVYPGAGASKKEVEAYNKQVDAWNKKTDSYMSNPTNLNSFLSKMDKMDIPVNTQSWGASGFGAVKNAFTDMFDGMFNNLSDGFMSSTP